MRRFFMKLPVKRIAVALAAVMMVLSMVLMCSCEKRKVYKNVPITLPLEETYTLSYWMNFDNTLMSDYESYADHPFYKWLETKTNIHIDFQVPTSPANDIVALRGEWMNRIAADDMTEMVEHYYFVPDLAGDTIDSADEEELYYVLNEFIDVQMDNFKALRDQYAVINKLLVTPYENIMYIPKLTGVEDENKEAPITQGLVIRKDILDTLQEEVPVTIADWERILSKMQLSGISIPLTLGKFDLDAALLGDPFLSAYGVSYKFHINAETGKLDYGCISEGMKNYVTLLNGWYTAGYLDTSMNPTVDMKISNDQIGAFYATMEEIEYLNGLGKQTNPNYELVACPYPVLNEGDTITVYDTYMPIGNREVNATYITYKCESPALAAKWLDQLFSEEAFNRASYGEENVDYTVDAEGKISFTDKVMKGEENALFGVHKSCLLNSMYCDRDVLVDLIYTDEQKKAIETWSNVSRERSVIRTTSMNHTIEEETAMKDHGNFFFMQFDLRTFINGGDLTGWDAYVQKMNEAGMQEYIAIEQAAWDRYLAN